MAAHRGAFEHDWRARFGVPLREVGESMSWGEALRLTRLLADDPSTQVAAALLGWSHPLSREGIMLADLYDLTMVVALAGSKQKPKPYPRPWKTTERTAPGDALSQDEIIAALRRAGHTAPLPPGVDAQRAEVISGG